MFNTGELSTGIGKSFSLFRLSIEYGVMNVLSEFDCKEKKKFYVNTTIIFIIFGQIIKSFKKNSPTASSNYTKKEQVRRTTSSKFEYS